MPVKGTTARERDDVHELDEKHSNNRFMKKPNGIRQTIGTQVVFSVENLLVSLISGNSGSIHTFYHAEIASCVRRIRIPVQSEPKSHIRSNSHSTSNLVYICVRLDPHPALNR